MNSMSNGFLYTLGFGWALAECCLVAVGGNALPLLLFVLAFLVVFAALGCLTLSDSATNTFGAATAAVLALVLLIFTANTFVAGAIGMGLIKLFFAAVFVAGAALAFLDKGKSGEAAHH